MTTEQEPQFFYWVELHEAALRPYLEGVEAFILDKAGIEFDPTKAAAGGLRVAASAA